MDSTDATTTSPLRRLTVVATSAWLVSADGVTGGDPPSRLRELLQRLLHGSPHGQAFLCADPRVGTDDPAQVPYLTGDEADAQVEVLVERLGRVLAELPGSESVQDTHTAVAQLRHRVYLDATRFAALTGLDTHPDIRYVTFDLRLYQIRTDLRWHASISIDSRLAHHPQHRPQELTEDGPQLVTGSAAECRQRFARAARKAEDLLRDFLDHATFRVLDRTYLQADFWIGVPADTAADPAAYIEDPVYTATINELTRKVLMVGDMRDDVVTTSVLNGDFLTLRRISRKPGPNDPEYAPLYLIVPAACGGADADVEHGVHRLVLKLADLEARAGDLLDDVQHDLYVWRNHLDVYQTVAGRGARLWDSLATHLPVLQWRKLGKVHGSMDLMHQVLLQGIADLSHLAGRTQSCRAQISATAAALGDIYDDAITERHLTGQTGGVRAALTETGLISKLVRGSDEVAAQAIVVQRNYQSLLDAITKAFDERRVREGDALQRASMLFGISIALVGVVTVADATVDMKPVSWLAGDGVARWSAGLSLFLGALLLASALLMLGWLLRVGRLGTSRFRTSYDELWHFMRDSSTESLEEFSTSDRATPQSWAARDLDLSQRFARLWDRATDMPVGNPTSRDIRDLSRRIEQWSLHALLATERARRLYDYRLPLLTCLYRCAARLPGSFFELGYLSPTPNQVNLVSVEEFARTMRESLGLPRPRARQVDEQCAQEPLTSAQHALEFVTEVLDQARRQR
ncbi:hypothetical protein [Catellatospora tritici]|uniref:hypothetical protein n=1 Tax=Catellatospora tritici TaxID=2851566 RepID=UPI001C2D73D1|nr:hypothetical protein [Catellatospora tritici]MBV1853585.1 hypothetical protein [Catellatospora tritici]